MGSAPIPGQDDLHVAIAATGELFGGVERHILSFLSAAENDSVSIILFHDHDLAKRIRAAGIEPIIIRRQSRVDRSSVVQFRRAVLESNAEILHIHGYLASTYAALSDCQRFLPILKTEHGLPEFGNASRLTRFKSRTYNIIDRWATRRCVRHIAFVSNELRSATARDYPNIDSSTIYNGVNPDVVSNTQPREFSQHKRNIVCAGRLEYVKGFDIAIRAISSIDANSIEMKLHIFGDGPEAGKLQSLAKSLNATTAIQFHGFRNNIEWFIRHADALLISSRHEGMPYVLLEAMAHKTLIVASETGGLCEILRNNKNAITFACGDHIDLARKLLNISTKNSITDRIIENAYNQYAVNYSADAMLRQYVEKYTELLTLSSRKIT